MRLFLSSPIHISVQFKWVSCSSCIVLGGLRFANGFVYVRYRFSRNRPRVIIDSRVRWMESLFREYRYGGGSGVLLTTLTLPFPVRPLSLSVEKSSPGNLCRFEIIWHAMATHSSLFEKKQHNTTEHQKIVMHPKPSELLSPPTNPAGAPPPLMFLPLIHRICRKMR